MTNANIHDDLDNLPDDLRKDLDRFGFDRNWFVGMVEHFLDPNAPGSRTQATVEPVRAGDIVDLPDPSTSEYARLVDIGTSAIAAGECAFAVLAGGMATRMGGVVKALVDVIDGATFLDLRLAERASLERAYGGEVPFWLMTSNATEDAIRESLGSTLDDYRTATFAQKLSLRLAPDGGLFRDRSGRPSEHSPGHGDFPEVLVGSGLLREFRSRGGRVVTMCNIDNLGATLDPAVIGMHLDLGSEVTCEVVDKEGGDRGGGPVRIDGRPAILEEFRLPETFDPSRVEVFNTNTFHFDADALAGLDLEWSYAVVEKNVDDSAAIQFERIVNEVTHALSSSFVRVPRHGDGSRFIPVKDNEELAKRREDIRAVAKARDIL